MESTRSSTGKKPARETEEKRNVSLWYREKVESLLREEQAMILQRVYKKLLPADGTNAVELIDTLVIPAGKSVQLRSLHIVTDNSAAVTVTIGTATDERKFLVVAATSQNNLPLNYDGWASWAGGNGDLYIKLGAALAASKELHIYATFVIS